jgi:hypothetical protein
MTDPYLKESSARLWAKNLVPFLNLGAGASWTRFLPQAAGSCSVR